MNGRVVLYAVCCALMGYFIGNVNPAFLISRMKGFDIREEGSGNAGATNAGLIMGQRVGALIAVFDVAKACVAVYLAVHLFRDFSLAAEVAGTSCILGHMFPIFLHFQGGKGLACLAGIILAYNPMALVILFFGELIPVLIIGYGCAFPFMTAVLVPILYLAVTKKAAGALVYCVASIAIIYKHLENVQKIRTGEEIPIRRLWERSDG